MSFSTPDLCDDHPDAVRVLEIDLNNYGSRKTFCGEIVTIKCFEDNSLVKDQANQPGKGKVMVVDGGGSARRALLGDMIAEKAVENGWEGIIIYGRIRDVDIINTLDLGVQALGTVPVKTEKRGIGDLNVPLHFGGIDLIPGEYVYADNNGVVVSSQKLL
ncbi:putative 4-hydroxy-4-methyl-2-oxoglutarate aldolase [Paraneptunicella aestuarii]|uniref:putative 4-hydroxy-4-methyl-2-oxoglutarate aldolase n=1 Tax=Paraneptunicella aestuarii TaxID=2831148 RepID=UPI001E647739|nr:putative 4-hydroxy-4-methyl-2-oxoglutarate aldolase [Paraneptunicella aestuarii]UAA39835.1 putative 4-hydroxy-4-methyl-2-oxoglutarate aldolase [Paraneptunicella aestuarii]